MAEQPTVTERKRSKKATELGFIGGRDLLQKGNEVRKGVQVGVSQIIHR